MKRVLIINSNSINTDTATGTTLQSIFHTIHPAHLMELYWADHSDSKPNISLESIKLSFAPLSPGAILNHPRIKKVSKRIKKLEVAQTQSTTPSIKHLVKHLRQAIALSIDYSSLRIPRSTMNRLIAYNPEVIYTLGGSIAAMKLSYRLSKKFNIPIVIHFMDNWRHCIEWDDNPLLANYKYNLKKWCNLCYSRSTRCIAISQRMADVYTSETGVPHSVIMNSIRPEEYYHPPRTKDGTIRFVYAGGLHLGRNEALYSIGQQIDQICDYKGVSAEFLIYTSPENISFWNNSFSTLQRTRLVNSVPHNMVKDVYANADILVHAENCNSTNIGFFKYSVSTKISEYLSSGRTVLFYGSNDIYQTQLLRENHLAAVAHDLDGVAALLNQLIAGSYPDVSQAAFRYAKEHFSTDVAAQLLCDTLNSVHLPR